MFPSVCKTFLWEVNRARRIRSALLSTYRFYRNFFCCCHRLCLWFRTISTFLCYLLCSLRFMAYQKGGSALRLVKKTHELYHSGRRLIQSIIISASKKKSTHPYLGRSASVHVSWQGVQAFRTLGLMQSWGREYIYIYITLGLMQSWGREYIYIYIYIIR